MKKVVSIVLAFALIIVMSNAVFACTVKYRVYCHYNAYINTRPNGTIPGWSFGHHWAYGDWEDDWDNDWDNDQDENDQGDNDQNNDEDDNGDEDDDERPEFSDWRLLSWVKGLFPWFRK